MRKNPIAYVLDMFASPVVPAAPKSKAKRRKRKAKK